MNGIKKIWACILKKSQIYRMRAYKEAKPLSKNKKDMEVHFFAFLIDINCCFFPVYVWFILFLFILCGLIPPIIFDLLFYVMYVILCVSCVIGLGILTSKTHGQSIGYYLTGLKLVNAKDKTEASSLHLILRQMFGFGIPVMVLGFFFKTFGVVLWWLINGVVVLVTPYQQTIFDLVFHLIPVKEPNVMVQIGEQATSKKPVENKNSKSKEKNVLKPSEVSPIDLHIRSNYSDDGCYDVEQIFKQAKEKNMEVISITDHNCARVNAAAPRFSQLYGIQYIPGVEFDCQFRGTHVRVLGYYIDWDNKIFDALEQESLKREKQASIERVKKFEDFTGIGIDLDAFMSKSRFQTITADQITRMVFKNRQTRELDVVQYYLEKCSSEKEAMLRFKRTLFEKNGPCSVELDYPDMTEIIKAIHQANGIAILSSWHLDYIDDRTIETLLDQGMDGIECFSPEIHDETMTAVLKICQQRKLFVSAGSDYHGPTRPARKLGVTKCPAKGLSLVRIFTKAAE